MDGDVGALPLTDPGIGAASTAAPAAMASGTAPAYFMAAHQPAGHQPVTPPARHQPAAPQPAAHQPAAYQPAAYQPAATVSQLAPGGNAATAGGIATPPSSWTGEPIPSQDLASGALPVGTAFGESSSSRAPRSARAGWGGAVGGPEFGPRPSTTFGPRPTATAHPFPDEMSAARGGSAPSSATRGTGEGGYGQPFAATASQSGERDREHRSKYLVHDDSHSIVGDLPPTAPPVIGADY